MKIMNKHSWLALFFVFLLTAFSIPTESQAEVSIPDWVRSNAGWWATDQIDDSNFVLGIEFMIKEGIIQVPPTEQQENVQSIIPDWIKNNARWWADGIISDNEFTKSIEYLLKINVIRLDSGTNITQAPQTLETNPAATISCFDFSKCACEGYGLFYNLFFSSMI